MRKAIHQLIVWVVSVSLIPSPLFCQDNHNWILNISEGEGAASINLQDWYPEVAVSGNTVHSLWLTHAPGAEWNNYELNYRRSANNGESWENKVKLYEGLLDVSNTYNRLVVAGPYVHIVVSLNSGTAKEVLYFRSTDGGATFEPPKVLTTTPYDLYNLHIDAQGSKVGVSYTIECWWCGTKKWVTLSKSSDNGGTFENVTVLEDLIGDLSNFANIKIEGDNVYLIYLKSIGYWGNYDFELHLLSSNNFGTSFIDQVISIPAMSGQHHAFSILSSSNGYFSKIAADGNKVWVIWSGWDETNQAAVFLNRSFDAGATVSAPVKVSGDIHYIHAGLETVVAKGDFAYIILNTIDERLYANYSSDGGATFGVPVEFTNPDAQFLYHSIEPQLAIDPIDNGALILSTGPVFGKISPQGKISGPTLFGSYSFTSSRRPKMAVSPNGYAHLVMEGGGEWLATGSFADNEVWYRRVNLLQTDAGETNRTANMQIIPNPGDGSGLSRFDNMIIGPDLADHFVNSFTVELWVKPQQIAEEKKILTQMHRGTWNINNPRSFQLWATANNQPVAGIATSTGAYAIWGQKNMAPGFWNHLAVTYENNGSGSNFKLLLNGQVIASTTAIGEITPLEAMWSLGCISGGFGGYLSSGFLGGIDELRFWDIALTPEQIRQNRFANLTGDEEGLVAYFNFNYVSPFGEVTDITGNGHTGHFMYKEESVPSNIHNLGARFTYTQSVSAFTFTQISEGGESYQWDFGNGTQSTMANPSVTYTSPGIYQVCLDVFGNGIYDSYCEAVEVKGIDKIIPTEGGNTDYVTLYVYGGGFNTSNIVKLRRSGFEDIVAEYTVFDEKKTLTAVFNLAGQEIGIWDLVVADGTLETILPGAFQIVAGEKAAPYVLFNGGGTILVNRWTPQTLKIGNSANVDAHGVLLWVTIPDEPGNDIAFLNLNVKAPQLAIDNGYEEDLEALGYFIAVDSLFGKPSHSRVYTFYFPILPAKSSFDIMVRVKIGQGGGSIPMQVWVSEPFYQSPLSVEVQACVALSIAKACIKGGLGFIPGVPCITGTLAITSDYLDDQPPTPSAYENIETRSWFWILGTNLLECGVSLIPGGNIYAGILGLITAGVENGQENADCYRGFRQIGWLDILYYPVFSLDPNVKNGLQGYAEEGFIGPQSRLSYQIQFENKNTATAPAQEVVIIDTLTYNKIDLSNFSFGAFGWGDTLLFPLPGSKEFGIDIDLRPEKNLIVRVTGELNETEKIVKWRFLSLDPATMDLVTDALGGFLPPNNTPPEGEGFVTFTTGLYEDIQHNELIENKAFIVFDVNAPIITNLHRNRFDLVAPVSELSSAIVSTTDTLITLNLSAFDDESRVRDVEIWVSENDSAYVFNQRAANNAVQISGKPGFHYKFYSVAIDSVGNREEAPLVADAEVSILVNTVNLSNISNIRLYPVPTANLLTLEMNLLKSADLVIRLEDGLGKVVHPLFSGNLQQGYHRLPFKLHAAPGMYFLYISDGTGSKTEKVIIVR